MVDVIGISFDKGKRIYYFSPNSLELNINDKVIVETERGKQYGTVVTNVISKKVENLNLPLKNVLKKADLDDENKYKSNIELSKKAMKDCERLLKKYKLNMKLIDSSFTFDREQLMFHFLSDVRIDFRALAKDLAAIYKTRIELRQVGVRDKAKEIGGIGPCGRLLCCSKYLVDFDSVSINMAKNQNISLNPTKINGVCGRLLCCLTYENETYEEYRKELPNLGERVKYKEKSGKVVSLDILNKSYSILTDDEEYLDVNVNDSTK